MTEIPTDKKCELCGDAFHFEADTEPGWLGLICPGDRSTEEEKGAFRTALTKAYADEVAEQTERMDALWERKDEWYKRERAEVTQDELQADCDVRVEAAVEAQPWLKVDAMTPDARVEELLTADELAELGNLDVDIPHITVPGKVPAPRGGIQVVPMELEPLTPEQKAKENDPMIFLDPEPE